MKKWLNDHPYLLTSAIFLAIILFGWHVLYWRWENFAFLLLLYFIVTLGIRLDDISKKIGSGSKSNSSENENILKQLHDIKLSLRTLNVTLNRFLQKNAKENSSRDKPD